VFAVLFEVHPDTEQSDAYFGYAKMLRPDLEAIDGFVDNIRYRSLTRSGWILSLSSWRNEKALVRWRTLVRHHEVQVKGRSKVLADYHLRVGQITTDNHVPQGNRLEEQRLDVTEVGKATAVTLINPQSQYQSGPIDELDGCELAQRLGLDTDAEGLISWDIFDAVLEPGNPILVQSWADAERAAASLTGGRHDLRRRTIRIVRDYGMFDRRESPQYYPDVVPHPAGA
jgi:heme-degrading monooxygenase HmoA